jgi:hypothetical protein
MELISSGGVYGVLGIFGTHYPAEYPASDCTELRANDHTDWPSDNTEDASSDGPRFSAKECAYGTASNLVRCRVICHA